jgi:hypothetical protein
VPEQYRLATSNDNLAAVAVIVVVVEKEKARIVWTKQQPPRSNPTITTAWQKMVRLQSLWWQLLRLPLFIIDGKLLLEMKDSGMPAAEKPLQ